MFTILQNLYTTAVFFTWIFFARTPFCHRTMLRTWWSVHSIENNKQNNKNVFKSSWSLYDHHHHDLHIWSSSWWSLYPIHAARSSLGSSRSERDVRPATVLNSLKQFWFKIQFYISGSICSDIQMFADIFKTLLKIITRKKFEDCWIEMAEPRREPALKDWKVK